jgi:hypothetical protein
MTKHSTSDSNSQPVSEAKERNISVWFEALENVLFCVPPAFRLEVLRRLMASETERQEKPIQFLSFSDLELIDFTNRHAAEEAVSLIIQVLVRSITSDHSPDDAAKVLFREHRMGTGSGWLPDYLNGLPGVRVNLKRCRTISASNGKSELARDSSNAGAAQ